MIEKLYCYDPRTEAFSFTNNPGLIFGYYAQRLCSVTPDGFWERIKELADYCDQLVDCESKPDSRIPSSDDPSLYFIVHPVECNKCKKEFKKSLPSTTKRGDSFVGSCPHCGNRNEYIYEVDFTITMGYNKGE